MIGQTLGRYRIVAELGRGGMGVVYRATQTTLGREVAIKMLSPHLADSGEHLARFRREAQVLARLQHENIVHIYDVEEVEGSFCIVMEFVAGPSLGEVLHREGRLPEPRVRDIALALAAGLDAAHRKGIVHRDLKPDNILFTPEGRPKITDFGIARIAGDDAMSRTRTGILMGTPYYMSPEQARGEQVTGTSDLYALGVLLHQMLSGSVPFEGTDPISVAIKHMQETPPALREVAPGVHPGLAAVVERAMRKDPAHRYASAGEMARALRRIPLEEATDALPWEPGASSLARGGPPAGAMDGTCPACATPVLSTFLTCPRCAAPLGSAHPGTGVEGSPGSAPSPAAGVEPGAEPGAAAARSVAGGAGAAGAAGAASGAGATGGAGVADGAVAAIGVSGAGDSNGAGGAAAAAGQAPGTGEETVSGYRGPGSMSGEPTHAVDEPTGAGDAWAGPGGVAEAPEGMAGGPGGEPTHANGGAGGPHAVPQAPGAVKPTGQGPAKAPGVGAVVAGVVPLVAPALRTAAEEARTRGRVALHRWSQPTGRWNLPPLLWAGIALVVLGIAVGVGRALFTGNASSDAMAGGGSPTSEAREGAGADGRDPGSEGTLLAGGGSVGSGGGGAPVRLFDRTLFPGGSGGAGAATGPGGAGGAGGEAGAGDAGAGGAGGGTEGGADGRPGGVGGDAGPGRTGEGAGGGDARRGDSGTAGGGGATDRGGTDAGTRGGGGADRVDATPRTPEAPPAFDAARARAELTALVDRQRRATESGDATLFARDLSAALARENTPLLAALHREWSAVQSEIWNLTILLQGETRALVDFHTRITGVHRRSRSRSVMEDTHVYWVVEAQGGRWVIVEARSAPHQDEEAAR